jgi:hypothetical protein
MKNGFLMLTALFSLSPAMFGQAAPAGVATNASSGSSLVPSLGGVITDGTVHYSLSAGEIIQHGLFSGSGNYYSTNLSGTAGYVSPSERYPFSMLYSGGLLLTTQNQATVQTYQNASISQEFVMTPHWSFGVADSVSYLPQSPTTGYSGIAGVGDIGPIQGPAQGPAGGILTNYGNRVSNSASGNIERKLTASTSVSGLADWDILRFVDGNGLDTTGISGTAALNHRLNGRTSISGNVMYSIFTYGSYGAFTYGSYGAASDPLGLSNLSIQTRGANLVVTRLLSRNFSLTASGGPQLINSSNSKLVPPRTTGAGAVSLTYVHKITSVSVSYNRGASGGSGVQQGSLSDSVTGSVSHSYGRDWQASVSGSYSHSDALITNQQLNQFLGVNGTYNSVFGGVQVSHRLSQSTSAYASYTAQEQSGSYSSVSSPNVFSGISNIFSIGITWAPRSTRLGQF